MGILILLIEQSVTDVEKVSLPQHFPGHKKTYWHEMNLFCGTCYTHTLALCLLCALTISKKIDIFKLSSRQYVLKYFFPCRRKGFFINLTVEKKTQNF